MKQGTRRYEEARKRQERSPCAPGWLACAVTNDAEILPSQTDAEDHHRKYQVYENARSRQDRGFDHDSRTTQQSGREYCIPGIFKTYGSDLGYATEANVDKVARRMSFRALQKTRLARSNQPFSSAVNGLTAWLGVALGGAKAGGGGA
jgi:hypothetical protein